MIKDKIKSLVFSWKLGLPNEPKIHEAYEMLKREGETHVHRKLCFWELECRVVNVQRTDYDTVQPPVSSSLHYNYYLYMVHVVYCISDWMFCGITYTSKLCRVNCDTVHCPLCAGLIFDESVGPDPTLEQAQAKPKISLREDPKQAQV